MFIFTFAATNQTAFASNKKASCKLPHDPQYEHTTKGNSTKGNGNTDSFGVGTGFFVCILVDESTDPEAYNIAPYQWCMSNSSWNNCGDTLYDECTWSSPVFNNPSVLLNKGYCNGND